MKKLFFFLVAIFSVNIFADTVDIDIPEAVFAERNGSVVPKIEGFELDGTGEEVVLPFKKMVFGSEIVKVEILKKHKIVLEAPLKKGGALYRLTDMHKVDKAAFKRNIPSLSKFTFNHSSTYKRKARQFSFDFYPLIPAGEKEVVKIDRIRVTTKGTSLFSMRGTKGGNSLLILTTEYFLAGSQEIDNYIKAKRESGFRVDIATEMTYGGGDLKGIKRVEKIREYLRSVYQNYDFLLIIAGTDPNGDEVPMVVTKPDTAEDPSYEQVPTDIFYAELTEDMDGDGNGVYGERYDDIRYAFELVVGRIPIYGRNITIADKILARTVKFIREKPSESEIRRRILFPTTISYYEKQDNQYGIPKMDGAYIAEYLRYYSIRNPFTSKVLVEKAGIDPSEFTEEEGLDDNSMLKNMNEGNGIVFWQAHGMPTYSVRTIWRSDSNSNGIPETYRYELYSDTFVSNEIVDKISAENFFVFQGSCLNGTIEIGNSLAYNVLRKTAVGVVGASQVSYGAIYSDYDLAMQDIFAYGTVFTDAAVNNEIPAKVFFETKEMWSDSSVLLTIKLETNYLGDPSLKLNIKTCGNDSDCDDSLFCNGKEICVEGFCEKEENSVPCLESAAEACSENKCDEASKSCTVSRKPDGSFCGSSENKCVGGRQCFGGECIDMNLKDCSELDSECSTGACEPETGECVRVSANEGASCSTGKFCVKNEVCTNGFCQGEAPDLPEAEKCSKTECSESDGFITVSDISQNWDDCTTSDGRKGYCDYGSCTPKKQQDKAASSSSGCSATVL